jgi:hypothetical protein
MPSVQPPRPQNKSMPSGFTYKSPLETRPRHGLGFSLMYCALSCNNIRLYIHQVYELHENIYYN